MSKVLRKKSRAVRQSVVANDASVKSLIGDNNEPTTPKIVVTPEKTSVRAHLSNLSDKNETENKSNQLTHNPYVINKPKQSMNQVTALLDSLANQKPPDVEQNVWILFLDFKKAKIEKTNEAEKLNDQIESMTAEINALKANQKYIQDSVSELIEVCLYLSYRLLKFKCIHSSAQ